MVPEGWSEHTIESAATAPVSYGVVQTGDSVEDGIPCVRVVDLVQGDLDPSLMITTSNEISDSYRRTILSHCDIMIALRGVIGRAALVPKRLAGCNLTRGIARFSVDRTKFCPEFLVQLLNYPAFNYQLSRRAGGSALQEISIGALRGFKFTAPPITEQRQIAEILDTWDGAIDTTENLIATSEAQKKALMQQFLSGKKRLPGFDGMWKSVSFDTLFERVKAKNVELNENVLTISAQLGLVSQTEYFNKSVAGKDLSGYTLLKRGDFAYNKSYSAGYPMGAIKPLKFYEKGIVSSLYICFRICSDEAHHDFYRHYFEGGYFNKEIYGIAQEGARNHGLLNVGVTDFFTTRVFAPQIEEQRAIADVINAAEQEVIKLQELCRDLKSEKAALMQQLLTGKRRVKIEETAA